MKSFYRNPRFAQILIALLLSSIHSYAQTAQAYYPFNGNADDESGNNHHGTVYGASLVTDRFNAPQSAYSFDGNNDYIEFDNEIGQFGTSDFSVSFWVKTTSSNNMKFIGNRSTCSNGFNWEVSIYQNKMRGVVNQPNAVNQIDVRGNIIVTDNVWHHVIFMRMGTTAKIYVDCVLDETETIFSGVANVTSSAAFKVGLSPCSNVDDSTPYQGRLDDIRLYDYALNLDDVSCLCNSEQIDFSLGNNPITANCSDSLHFEPIIDGGTGNYTFEWRLNGTIVSTLASYDLLAASNSVLSLTITDDCDNYGYDEVEILLPTTPIEITNLEDISLQCLDLVELTPVVIGGTGNYFYVWTVNEVVVSNTETLSLEVNSNTNVTLTVTDDCAGYSFESIEISATPYEIEISNLHDTTVTCSQSVLLLPSVDGTGNYNYAWTVNGTSLNVNTSSHLAYVNSNTTITLTVTDECNGYGYEEIEITVIHDSIQISNLEDLTVPCYGLFTLDPSIAGGEQPFSYSWYLNDIWLIDDSTLTTTISEESIVTLVVTDQCGYESTTDITISLTPSNLAVEINANDLFVCQDDQVELSTIVSNAIGDVEYLWSNSNSENSITVTPPFSASYTVTVTDACSFVATDSYELNILSTTPLSSVENEFEFCTNVFYSSLVQGGATPYSYIYDEELLDLDGDSFMSQIDDISTPITVTDQCGNSSTFTINVTSCDFLIPNIFTPNSDASNDFFQIKGIEKYTGSSLSVYNRWGNLIFESNNYRNQWSGSEQEDGVYYYSLKRSDGVEYSGYVQIVR